SRSSLPFPRLSPDLLRARQEVAAAAAARTPGAMEAHIPSAGNSSSQRRKQGLPQHRDSHFPDREISHPPPLLSPQNAPHIALGPHLRPPFLGVPSALCQTPGECPGTLLGRAEVQFVPRCPSDTFSVSPWLLCQLQRGSV
ncbi:sterile alpha motif domain-containing protein 11-like, partial [Malurus melanocephalus]|uniref:sterile alpha motif domain-containing protein 11-like n=1 Tax=Malurus melanocephalus TaxID=175006 RepID=UPI0025485DD7